MRRSYVWVSLLAAAVAVAAAGPSGDIVPLQATYRGTVLQDGQTQDIGERTVTVRAADIDGIPAWQVITALQLDSVATADTVEFQRADLRPLARRAKFGDAEIVVVVDHVGVLRGMIFASRNLQPINLPLGKMPFLNYYALWTALAAWPLERSWYANVSILEFHGGGLFLPLHLAVSGEERIAVPGGTFDCWVVTVEGQAGALEVRERYWVNKQDRIVVRTEEPFAGGRATLRLELTRLVKAP